MTKANRLGMFADVRFVLDQALEHGGGTFTCASPGAAIHWRQRAYKFRKLYAETLGPRAMSPYDVLVLPRLAPEATTVEIKIRQHAGTFVPANEPVPVTEDELMSEALELARKLGG